MAFSFHTDAQRYYAMQVANTRRYVVPFVRQALGLGPAPHVLEVGCAEGGVLKAFLEDGATGVGVELVPQRLEVARQQLAPELAAGRVALYAANIYDWPPTPAHAHAYDVVVLKDVVEHIPDTPRLLRHLAGLLRPGGGIFLGFPPWQMPFGGHQQICRSRVLSRLPYVHLLPRGAYRALLRLAGEPPAVVQELLELQQTGLSLEAFERAVRIAGLQVVQKEWHLINPIYELKFGLRPRRQWRWLAALPWVRNFFTTSAFYVVAPGEDKKV